MKKLLGMAVLLLGMFVLAPGAHAAEVTASAVTTMSPAQVAQLSIVLANLKTTLEVIDAELKAGRIPETVKPTLNATLTQLSITLVAIRAELPASNTTAAPGTGVPQVVVAPSAPAAPAPAPRPSPPVAVAPQPPAAPAPLSAVEEAQTAQVGNAWNRQMPWVIAAIVLLAIGIGYSRREAAPEMIAMGPINEPAESAMPIEFSQSSAPSEAPKPPVAEASPAPTAPPTPPANETPNQNS
jgi:hypothetical protein